MEKLTSLSDEMPVSSFPKAWDSCSVSITPMHQCIHAAGIDQCNARQTKGQVTVKFKTFPSDFNNSLCREKPQMNQLGLRTFLDDDASSQKGTVKKQGKFHNR